MFKFRLETVLGHRRHQEDMALAEYAKRVQAQNQCVEQMDWLRDELSRARSQIVGDSALGMPGAQYMLGQEYLTSLRTQLLQQEQRLRQLAEETDRARRRLIKAQQNRKALEAMRENHLGQWRRQQLQLEQKALDEVAVGGFARKEQA